MNDKKLKTLYDTFERCKILIEKTGIFADILQIQNSGQTDYMDRPIWVDQDGKIWVDVDMDDRNPNLHDVCSSGEPNCPIECIWESVDDMFTQHEIYKFVNNKMRGMK